MALFPAYEDKNSKPDVDETQLTWLRNESFPDVPSSAKEAIPQDQLKRCENETSDDELSSDSGEDNGEAKVTLHKKKKDKKKKKKSDKKSDLKEYSRKRKKKSSHKKKKKSHYSSDTEPAQTKSGNEFSIVDGRQKGVLFDGDFRSLKKEDIIYMDRLPDRNNSVFCNTHYSQLCSYHKSRFHPMGFKRKIKPKKKVIRYFDKPSDFQHDPTPVIRLKQSLRNSEYVSLNLTYEEEQKVKKDQLQRNLRNDSVESNHDAIYRNVFDKQVRLSEDGLSEKDYWQNLNKCFNENLSKDPHNISLWLEFLDIQDKVMAHCFSNNDKKITKFETNQKSVIERKVAVIESAIGKNPKALKLYLKRLHLGETVWEIKKLESEWNKLVHTFPNEINVWHNYLIFHQTYFSSFHLDHVVKAYSKCSEKLIQMQQKTFLSHKPPDNLVFELVDVTAELAFIWYQGGFMERSIALFQALIELNFFCPQQLTEQVDVISKIEIFEAFWDSKAPRFGENNSVGWAKFMEKRESVIFAEKILEGTQDEEDEILLNGGSKTHLWLEIEFSRECNHWLSWQEDPEYCEDLERMVSFGVIKRHLFFLNTEEEKFYLILKFLSFLGVSIQSNITEENFPLKEYDSAFFPSRLETLENVVDLEKEKSDKIGLFNFPVIGPSVLKSESEIYFEFICGIIHKFISLLDFKYKIKLAVILIGLYTKRILALKKKASCDMKPLIKGYKKNIKNLLKESEFRSDSMIYYEYAQFEASIGNNDDACKIHSMILKLTLENNGDIFNNDVNSENIWHHLVSYVRLHLERDTIDNKIINDLLSVVHGITVEGKYTIENIDVRAMQILKLRNKLNSFIDTNIDCLIEGKLERPNILCYSISLLTMILLIIEGFEEVCLIFEKFIGKLCSQDSEHIQRMKHVQESIYFDYLWTLDVAINKDHFRCSYSLPQSLVRTILKSAINVAPNNLYFLENFSKKQNWRDMLCGSDIQPKGDGSAILVTIFRILPHIKKVMTLISSAEFGNISAGYQLQSILESAVNSDNGKNCPLLWRIYLRLISVTKPKDLLSLSYRALHSCPFAKCLYLDCIQLIPEKMNDILRTMTEKGIRIRLPVEELEVLLEEEREDEGEEEQKETDEQVNVSEEEGT